MKHILSSILATICFLPIYGQHELADMNEPTISSEQAIFEGIVIKSDPAYTDSVRIYVFDLLDKEGHTLYCKMDSFGYFHFDIQSGTTASINFYHGNDYEGFLLIEPGETTSVTLDERKKENENRWLFGGSHAEWNNGMNALPDSTRFYSLYRKITREWKRYTDSEDEFVFMETISPLQEDLEERIWSSNVSDEVKSFNYLASKLYYIELLSGYAITLNQLSVQRGMDRGVSRMFYKDAVKEDILRYNSMLYTPLGSQLKRYSILCNEQRGAHFSYPKFLDKIDYGQKAMALLHAKKLLNERQLNAIEQRMPELYPLISSRNERLRSEQLEAMRNPMYHIKYIDEDISGKNVYHALVEQYEGKIVLIDLWATWCMPCRIAMEKMKPLKETYKDLISFVYVTGETSAEDTWRQLIPDIKGEHFYLTDRQWKDLCKHIKVKSIPSYLLIDWDGLIVKQFTGFPGAETLENEIEELLEEKKKMELDSLNNKESNPQSLNADGNE